MGVLFTLFASILLYSKSRYSPKFLASNFTILRTKNLIKPISYSLFLIASIVFVLQLGMWTGLVVFMISWMLSMSLTVFIFPINSKLPYIICGLTLLFIILENIF